MNKIEIINDLNSRQWILYNYLKKRGDVWTTQEQISRDLKHIYLDFDTDIPFHDRAVRHQLTKDIREINESDLIHKPILSGAKGVKIANEQEFDAYIGANINSVIRRLKRLKKLANKADKNGQYRLKMSDYQKEVYEAFLN